MGKTFGRSPMPSMSKASKYDTGSHNMTHKTGKNISAKKPTPRKGK
jgi:hypothetical protein